MCFDEGALLLRLLRQSVTEVNVFARGGAWGESARADHLQEPQSFNQALWGEAGVRREYPRPLASPGQWHNATGSVMMSGEKESKSSSAYSTALMGYLEESCCVWPCVTKWVNAPCERACTHESKTCALYDRRTSHQSSDVVFVSQ